MVPTRISASTYGPGKIRRLVLASNPLSAISGSSSSYLCHWRMSDVHGCASCRSGGRFGLLRERLEQERGIAWISEGEGSVRISRIERQFDERRTMIEGVRTTNDQADCYISRANSDGASAVALRATACRIDPGWRGFVLNKRTPT